MQGALAFFATLPTVGTEIVFWLSIFGGIALFHMLITATLAAAAPKREPQGQ